MKRTINELKANFEANMLDGESVNACGKAMLSAENVWEYILETFDASAPGRSHDEFIAELKNVGHHSIDEELWRVKEYLAKLPPERLALDEVLRLAQEADKEYSSALTQELLKAVKDAAKRSPAAITLDQEIMEYENEIAVEKLAGNVVKEYQARGIVMGLRMAQAKYGSPAVPKEEQIKCVIREYLENNISKFCCDGDADTECSMQDHTRKDFWEDDSVKLAKAVLGRINKER